MAEAPAQSLSLPPAPARLAGEDGAPRFGLYLGAVDDAAFAALKDPYAPSLLERRLIEKKWQYLLVTSQEMMICLAVIDAGYLASGFCAVFDRGARRLLTNLNPILPSISAQIADQPSASATLTGPGTRASFQRTGAELAVQAAFGATDVNLKLALDRAPAPVTAIAPVAERGRFDFTRKTALVPAEGEVRAGNVVYPLRGDFAALDYTHGYLARDTAWRWALGMGRTAAGPVAFNLSEGFLLGEGENVAWIAGEPRAVGGVRFERDGDEPLGPWRIRSEDGRTELTFQPEGLRAQDVDLKLVVSRFLQPFGTFSGRLLGEPVEALAGVAEDHVARW